MRTAELRRQSERWRGPVHELRDVCDALKECNNGRLAANSDNAVAEDLTNLAPLDQLGEADNSNRKAQSRPLSRRAIDDFAAGQKKG